MQKKYRMTGDRTFKLVYRKGTRVKNETMSLLFLPNNKNLLKVAVVCSKKVGNSVVRNRVRRRIKESFRLSIPYIKSGYTYLITAYSNCSELSYNDLYDSLLDLLKKADKMRSEV